MADFLRRFPLETGTRMLDVGGFPQFWQHTHFGAHITTLNLQAVEVPPPCATAARR